MDSNRSRSGMLVGLAAAAGAFGVAVMMSAVTAPTARADAFSDIISSVEDEFTAGQADFASASADFGSGDPSDGLASFFSGLDDDVVGPGDSVYLQTVLVLLNEPDSSGPFFVDIGPEADFTSGLADAQSAFTTGEDLFAQAATDFSSGDYFDAADLDVFGSTQSFVISPEFLIEGVVAALTPR
jgi:hypothetical protein